VRDRQAEAVQAVLDGVSRETRTRLSTYVDLLTRWQARINLISRGTLDQVWTRHIADSLQLVSLLPQGARVLVDLGSGAGFPGLVLALATPLEVHLIESDSRKAAFLREAARLTGCTAQIHNARVEAVAPFPADVVTARALAPLPLLLDLAAPFLTPATCCLFPKGRQAEQELTEAARSWKMRADRFPSATDPTGTVLRVSEIFRA
jgi:16S rRNA (guanine527-N7)-methyltransferase